MWFASVTIRFKHFKHGTGFEKHNFYSYFFGLFLGGVHLYTQDYLEKKIGIYFFLEWSYSINTLCGQVFPLGLKMQKYLI